MTVHHDLVLTATHDHTGDFVVIWRGARSRQRFKISNTPSGAKPSHDFSNEAPVEAYFEVGKAKAFLFEPERNRRDLTVTRQHDPDASHGRAKVDRFPSRSWFGLHK